MLSSSRRYITDFQIRSTNGWIRVFPITEMEQLAQFIRTQGLYKMAKISFYIHDDADPTAFRNVILRQQDWGTGIAFVPEFCEAHQEEKDWSLVQDALRYGNLDDMFLPFIQTPFVEV